MSVDLGRGSDLVLSGHSTKQNVRLGAYVRGWENADSDGWYLFSSIKDASLRRWLASFPHPRAQFPNFDADSGGVISLGPAGSGLSFHFHEEAYSILLLGRKRWLFYAIGRLRALYRWLKLQLPRITARNLSAAPLECTQLPGEVMYIPSGFYHAVSNDAPTNLGVSYRAHRVYPSVDTTFYSNYLQSTQLLERPTTELAKAVRLMKRAIAINRNIEPLWTSMGNILWLDGRQEEALTALRTALTTSQSAVAPAQTLVQMYLSLRDRNAAADALHEVGYGEGSERASGASRARVWASVCVVRAKLIHVRLYICPE